MRDIEVLESPDSFSGLLFGCVGYEARSIYCLTDTIQNEDLERIYFDYKATGLLSYDENISVAEKYTNFLSPNFDEAVSHLLSLSKKDSTKTVNIDITSLDREKLAKLIIALFRQSAELGSINLLYCPATFQSPKHNFDVVQSFGPVLPTFMGNSVFLRENLSIIVGAGYEFGRIIGAIDTLEPRRVNCFMPIGTDRRYEAAVMEANLKFSFLEGPDSLIKYNLKQTFELYYNLRRIVEQENSTSNVMILPLGPKIFAAISMIIAMILHPNIMVWRHSTVDTARPNSISDAQANTTIISFAFKFR